MIREIEPNVQSVQIDDIYVSMFGARFMRNDVVLLGSSHGHACGLVWFHCLMDGTQKTVCEVWPLIRGDALRRHGKYRITDEPQLIQTSDIHAAAVYKIDKTIATALWPRTYAYP